MNIEFSHIDVSDKSAVYDLLYRMLPDQGCIEFQRDAANKTHAWHQHQNSETLLIIEGALDFFYEDEVRTCWPGDIIYLPSMLRHQSVASNNGCVYAIATQLIALS
ncbi:cupin domain-containing protein [Pantoea sp. FN0302]|uniref:cupin domain-containing protein n=1 Tax=Pantoea sp. FN0302 TaxID=3418558 RepID=UPI003CE801B7